MNTARLALELMCLLATSRFYRTGIVISLENTKIYLLGMTFESTL